MLKTVDIGNIIADMAINPWISHYLQLNSVSKNGSKIGGCGFFSRILQCNNATLVFKFAVILRVWFSILPSLMPNSYTGIGWLIVGLFSSYPVFYSSGLSRNNLPFYYLQAGESDGFDDMWFVRLQSSWVNPDDSFHSLLPQSRSAVDWQRYHCHLWTCVHSLSK